MTLLTGKGPVSTEPVLLSTVSAVAAEFDLLVDWLLAADFASSSTGFRDVYRQILAIKDRSQLRSSSFTLPLALYLAVEQRFSRVEVFNVLFSESLSPAIVQFLEFYGFPRVEMLRLVAVLEKDLACGAIVTAADAVTHDGQQQQQQQQQQFRQAVVNRIACFSLLTSASQWRLQGFMAFEPAVRMQGKKLAHSSGTHSLSDQVVAEMYESVNAQRPAVISSNGSLSQVHAWAACPVSELLSEINSSGIPQDKLAFLLSYTGVNFSAVDILGMLPFLAPFIDTQPLFKLLSDIRRLVSNDLVAHSAVQDLEHTGWSTAVGFLPSQLRIEIAPAWLVQFAWPIDAAAFLENADLAIDDELLQELLDRGLSFPQIAAVSG